MNTEEIINWIDRHGAEWFSCEIQKNAFTLWTVELLLKDSSIGRKMPEYIGMEAVELCRKHPGARFAEIGKLTSVLSVDIWDEFAGNVDDIIFFGRIETPPGVILFSLDSDLTVSRILHVEQNDIQQQYRQEMGGMINKIIQYIANYDDNK